jgi:hypothetical protein
MKRWKKLVYGIVWVTAASLCASQLLAQQEGGEKPKPAAREFQPLPDVSGDQQDSSVNEESQNLQPDNGPLTGMQIPTLGSTQIRHSYWVPGIQYSNTISSRSADLSANNGWNSTSYVTGNLSLLEQWAHSSFTTNYSGGGYFSTDSSQGQGRFDQLAMSYQIDERRWQLLFMNQFSYLPESAFGFGGGTGLSVPGIGGSLGVAAPGLQGEFVPNQSIFAAFGPRYSNSSAAQLTYHLSRRGSITLAANYGLLRFTEAGNIGNDASSFVAGYNYALSPKDTIAVSYLFTAYHFAGQPQALGDHTVHFLYGRKITGRLALQIAGGPEYTTFRVPISNKGHKISGSGNVQLTYAFKQGTVSLNYLHGIGGGSGVLVGASTDQFGASASRQLTRIWRGDVNFSYAKNAGLASLSGQSSPTFNTWYAGGGLSRPLGREMNFSMAYQADNQQANLSSCTGPTCNASNIGHRITLSFQWHTRPLVLR